MLSWLRFGDRHGAGDAPRRRHVAEKVTRIVKEALRSGRNGRHAVTFAASAGCMDASVPLRVDEKKAPEGAFSGLLPSGFGR